MPGVLHRRVDESSEEEELQQVPQLQVNDIPLEALPRAGAIPLLHGRAPLHRANEHYHRLDAADLDIPDSVVRNSEFREMLRSIEIRTSNLILRVGQYAPVPRLRQLRTEVRNLQRNIAIVRARRSFRIHPDHFAENHGQEQYHGQYRQQVGQPQYGDHDYHGRQQHQDQGPQEEDQQEQQVEQAGQLQAQVDQGEVQEIENAGGRGPETPDTEPDEGEDGNEARAADGDQLPDGLAQLIRVRRRFRFDPISSDEEEEDDRRREIRRRLFEDEDIFLA